MKLSKDLLEVSKKASKEAFSALEEMEDWAIKDDEINEKINEMLENFDDILKEKDIEKKSFIRFLAYLYTSDMINVLDQLNTTNPNFTNELFDTVNDLNENSASRFSFTLADRIIVLYKMSVIPELLSPKRLNQLADGIAAAQDSKNKEI